MRTGNSQDLYRRTALAVVLACAVAGCATGVEERRSAAAVDGMTDADAAEAALIIEAARADTGMPQADDPAAQQVAVAGLDAGFGEPEIGPRSGLDLLIDVPDTAGPVEDSPQAGAADGGVEGPVSGSMLLAESELVTAPEAATTPVEPSAAATPMEASSVEEPMEPSAVEEPMAAEADDGTAPLAVSDPDSGTGAPEPIGVSDPMTAPPDLGAVGLAGGLSGAGALSQAGDAGMMAARDMTSEAREAVLQDEVQVSAIGLQPGSIGMDEPVGDWLAEQNQTLRSTLTDWADRSGWRVVWKTNREYPLRAGAVFRGDFVGVSSALIRAFSRARPKPYATFYRGNRVLVISTLEGENVGE